MDVLEISGMFWVVAKTEGGRGFVVLDGPYQERHWAVSMSRLNEI